MVGGRALWMSLALVAITLLAYEGVRHFDFVGYDDPRYVSNNVHVAAGLTWASIRWACTTLYGPYWHPLTLLSHLLDAQIFGLRAGGHHVTNLLLHVANTLLLFAVFRRQSGAFYRSAFVAAMFAVHPLHVESVAWVTERLDVLSTLFWLLTAWVYVGYVKQPRRGPLLIMAGLYACGLMSKPVIVTLPIVLLLMDVWPLHRLPMLTDPSTKGAGLRAVRVFVELVREKLLLFGLALAAGIATLVFERGHGAVAGLDVLPLKYRLANVLVSYVTYIGKMCWPTRLAAFYPYPQRLPDWWVLAFALAFLVGVSIAAVWHARRHPYVALGWFWYLITLLPVIGFVQAADQAMADRFTYIPLIGLFVMIAWGVPDLLARWPASRTALPVVATTAILLCAVTTHTQAATWRNTITLWSHAIAVTRDNDRAHVGLGVALMSEGRAREALPHFIEAIRIAPTVADYHDDLGQALSNTHQWAAAIAAYTEALRLQPDFAEARTNLGYALAAAGRLDEAVAEYREALRVKPDLAETHVDLASALAKQGRIDEAMQEAQAGLRLNGNLAQAHSVLGAILQVQGKPRDAMAEYEVALHLNPNLAQAHSNLGAVLAGQGDTARAVREFNDALRLDASLPEAHNGLGVLLMTQHQVADAIAQYAEAIRLNPGFLSARSNLGVALAAQSDIAGAVREFTEILRLDPANPQARAALEYLKTKR